MTNPYFTRTTRGIEFMTTLSGVPVSNPCIPNFLVIESICNQLHIPIEHKMHTHAAIAYLLNPPVHQLALETHTWNHAYSLRGSCFTLTT
jgi:hypothetical protein